MVYIFPIRPYLLQVKLSTSLVLSIDFFILKIKRLAIVVFNQSLQSLLIAKFPMIFLLLYSGLARRPLSFTMSSYDQIFFWMRKSAISGWCVERVLMGILYSLATSLFFSTLYTFSIKFVFSAIVKHLYFLELKQIQTFIWSVNNQKIGTET